MTSSSGNSSMSTRFQSSGSEEDLQILMNQRKEKRKLSNCESARRSRMKKQKYLDDLNAEVEMLTKQNIDLLTRVNIATEQFLKIEAQNCILRAQIDELNQRLQSLNDILSQINNSSTNFGTNNSVFYEEEEEAANYCYLASSDHSFMNHHMNMNMLYLNQPIIASADHMFHWSII